MAEIRSLEMEYKMVAGSFCTNGEETSSTEYPISGDGLHSPLELFCQEAFWQDQ